MRRPTAHTLATLLAAALGATAAVACVRAAMGRLGKARDDASPGASATDAVNAAAPSNPIPTANPDPDAPAAESTKPILPEKLLLFSFSIFPTSLRVVSHTTTSVAQMR